MSAMTVLDAPVATATLTIASQLEPAFKAGLANHPAAPHVIAAPEDAPWLAADEAEVLVIRPSSAWRRAPAAPPPGWPGRLRWVFSCSAGIDFYPDWLLDAPLVSCGRGTASEEIADYVIAAIYARARDLPGAAVHRAADWQHRPLGRVIDSTVGLIGFGAIGQAVARRALALSARVVAVRRAGTDNAGIDGVELRPDAAAVVREADHIVIAVPATPATRHLFGPALLAEAKPGAHLINVARGSVVDQEALMSALDDGPLAFATLDVTEPEPLPDGHPLYTHPQVLLTPHSSANYLIAHDRLIAKLHADLARLIAGDLPNDLVDRHRGY